MSGFAPVWAASSRISHAALLSFRWLLVAQGGHGPLGDMAAPTGEKRGAGGCPAAAARYGQSGGSRTAQSLPRHCHLKDLFLSGWLKHCGRWFIVLLVPSHIKSKTS